MTFQENITHWYSIHKRDLPWRKTKNPYTIWLSEIILQQTQIKQGLPYYEIFVSNFPTVKALSEAPEDEVLKLWQGLGYYSRARNLHFTAKHIVSDLNGIFPTTYKDLLKLKGVGDYTASAIASIAYNEACAVVDGNVYRVLARYFGIKTPINSSKGIKEFKELAQKLLPKAGFGDYNQGLMEFGSRQCKPANPDCNVCPLNNSCVALSKGIIKTLPVKDKKITVKHKHFNFLVFISEDKKTLLEQRIEKGIWHKLYQFPLIESEKNLETMDENLLISKFDFLNQDNATAYIYNTKEVIHKLSHQTLHCKFWIIPIETLPEKAIKIASINNITVPVVLAKFIKVFNFETITVHL
jgi:A/G-specific adenine glycosylase